MKVEMEDTSSISNCARISGLNGSKKNAVLDLRRAILK
jgi:hypothetical protein